MIENEVPIGDKPTITLHFDNARVGDSYIVNVQVQLRGREEIQSVHTMYTIVERVT